LAILLQIVPLQAKLLAQSALVVHLVRQLASPHT
jgi:hypothetical protein